MFDCKKMTKTEREQARNVFALLCEYGYIGTSLMQRKLRIGYGRAAFLLDLFRYLELVDDDSDTRGRWPLKMAPRAAEDKLNVWLAEHAEEDAPDDGWETEALSEEPELNEGVDPLLPRLALTVGVNGDKRLLDRVMLERELCVSDERARAILDVLLETGVIEPCREPVYVATKDGAALRRLYEYMGMEMPAGEDVDCLAALLGGSEFTEEE